LSIYLLICAADDLLLLRRGVLKAHRPASQAKEKAKKQKELAKLEAAAKPALEVLGPDVTKAGFETADVDAWIELQPPPCVCF
jgi:hypothetical protein